jgi:hypothetical protein
VTALHVGYMDTGMTRHLDVLKSGPAAIAKLVIDGIEAGDAEIIADETSRHVLAGLSAGVAGLYPRSPDPRPAPARPAGPRPALDHITAPCNWNLPPASSPLRSAKLPVPISGCSFEAKRRTELGVLGLFAPATTPSAVRTESAVWSVFRVVGIALIPLGCDMA